MAVEVKTSSQLNEGGEERGPDPNIPAHHTEEDSPPSTTNVKSPTSSNCHNGSALVTNRSFSYALMELIDFGPLLLQCLLHPVESIHANIPHVIPSIFSRRKRFSPGDDIPDLGGRIILVTGGEFQSLMIKRTIPPPFPLSDLSYRQYWTR